MQYIFVMEGKTKRKRGCAALGLEFFFARRGVGLDRTKKLLT